MTTNLLIGPSCYLPTWCCGDRGVGSGGGLGGPPHLPRVVWYLEHTYVISLFVQLCVAGLCSCPSMYPSRYLSTLKRSWLNVFIQEVTGSCRCLNICKYISILWNSDISSRSFIGRLIFTCDIIWVWSVCILLYRMSQHSFIFYFCQYTQLPNVLPVYH